MRRIAFYLFYDQDGIVDDYIIYKLQKLREHVETIFVVSNSSLDKINREKIEGVCDIFYERENVGFDVWGYKEAMEHFGLDKTKAYDELILMNYTFFGPIFPFQELFSAMEKEPCDFWGISAHKEISPNPFNGEESLPFHIQSHFIAVRKQMFESQCFQNYWADMPKIESYYDSILKHESVFTKYFSDKGYTFKVYIDPQDYSSDYPLLKDIEQATQNRCPILKKRALFHDPIFLEQHAIFPRNVMEYIQKHCDYDINFIWKNLVRTVEPRTLYTNLDMLEVLPDSLNQPMPDKVPRIAVIAHMYYSDMIAELMSYMSNIPYNYDLYITTDSERKKQEMLPQVSKFNLSYFEIRVTKTNRGRDMAPMFVACQDVLLSEKYDYICRLHSKKSPQDGFQVGSHFKKHMYENLLYSKNYISNVLSLFETQPLLGVVMPPVIHIGYGTLGHSWSINKENVRSYCKKIGIKTMLDKSTPLAPYGGMYWFRPSALKKLASYPWKWNDFEVENGQVDGTLAHALERIIVYAAMDEGYYARTVMNVTAAALNYTKLEYKLQKLSSMIPYGQVRSQIDWLHFVHANFGSWNTIRGSLKRLLVVVFYGVKRRLKWAS
ncbi:Rhamnan synthesis protein F [Legionella massiliensis]|uniref:Rhamnan synthesis protein F n=1 Tax=Legionella massiliensis TaxID=1034943 RepID=A0A078KWT4_9GAMM|nr:rhamnan synthesis F family protein [Legionella massiliensis]CDZ76229.1 Rhamnan synthesis protein F [Legionella massiliensis]CEE11967.1 Rhamnan synthesis protein F [Legionella massiliensis]